MGSDRQRRRLNARGRGLVRLGVVVALGGALFASRPAAAILVPPGTANPDNAPEWVVDTKADGGGTGARLSSCGDPDVSARARRRPNLGVQFSTTRRARRGTRTPSR